mmetsp:Transcript_45222/g.142359  ORF Transcript_45222/g.142359 Transcript_45222/m.142359 type:complete len:264 (-) Transcript_45222:137-928(-)
MNSSATMQQGSHCDSNPDLEQRANNFLHLCLKMCQGDRDIEERTILRCRSEGSNQPQLARNIPFCESRTASAPASTNSNGKKKVRFFNEEGDEQHKGNIHLIYTESKKFKMFRTIPDEQIKACVSRMTTKCFRAGEMVIKSGTFGASLFLVDYGRAAAYVDGMEVGKIGRGDVFGEMSFLGALECYIKNDKIVQPRRSADVICETSCRLLEFSVEDLVEALKDDRRSKHDLTLSLLQTATIRRGRCLVLRNQKIFDVESMRNL